MLRQPLGKVLRLLHLRHRRRRLIRRLPLPPMAACQTRGKVARGPMNISPDAWPPLPRSRPRRFPRGRPAQNLAPHHSGKSIPPISQRMVDYGRWALTVVGFFPESIRKSISSCCVIGSLFAFSESCSNPPARSTPHPPPSPFPPTFSAYAQFTK